MTLSKLEESMTAREFYLWIGFDKLSPIGDERSDIQAAQVAAAIYQSKGAKVALSECLLDFSGKQKNENIQTLESLFGQLISR
ncbi:DUF4035 domain-containing protein [Orbus wheelerorum]|uniref:phage tail assembly protein T n=1 Tax=Orbus wheelerorum TaxID=3074111 RepID=UPI00370D475D